MNNTYGTHVLLESARIYGKVRRFINVSTDEVRGQNKLCLFGNLLISEGEGVYGRPCNTFVCCSPDQCCLSNQGLLYILS